MKTESRIFRQCLHPTFRVFYVLVVLTLSLALLTLFGSTGWTQGIYVQDRYDPEVLIPPNYYTFMPPSVGKDYVDPVFETTVRRLTAETRLVHVGQSEFTNFNADDSLFFSSIAGGVYLYDAETGAEVKQIGFNMANVRWSPTEADFFYYMTGSQIRKYDVHTMDYMVVHDFGTAIDDCGGDGNQISDDGRFWLINQGSEMFVYDLVNDQIYPRQDLGQNGFGCKSEGCIDFASISPTGNYILVNWYPVSSLSGPHGIEVYDKNWNFVSRNYPFNSHYCVGIIDGEEWIVAPAMFNSTPGAEAFNQEWGTTPGDLIAVKISEPDVRILMPMSVWTYFELGAFKGTRHKYIYVAAEERGYDPTDNCDYCCATCSYNEQSNARCGWYPYFGEIIEVPLDLSAPIRRLVHHRAFAPACLTHEYKNQPDFFVSHTGGRIVFQSNNGAEQPEAYMMWVTPRDGDETPPDPPPGPPPGDTPSDNGAPQAFDDSVTTLEDMPVTGSVSASDPDGDALTYMLVANGSLGTVTLTDPLTGGYIYEPYAGATGTDSFSFMVSDGELDSNVATVVITIEEAQSPSSGPPVLAELCVVDHNYTYPREDWTNAIDGDTDGWDGTVTAQDSPPYAIFGFAGGSTRFVSRFRLMTDTGVGYQNRWVSRFTVQVSVTDTDPSSFVTVLNRASKSGGGWQEYTIDPAKATYIKLIIDQPGWGWRQIGEFEVYAADAGSDVPPDDSVNHAPQAFDGSVKTLEDTLMSGRASASDPDGDALTYMLVADGSLGTVTLTDPLTGDYIYEPYAGVTGTDTFAFMVSDGELDSNVGTVTVTIQEAQSPSGPPVLAELYVVDHNYTYPREDWSNAIDGDTHDWDGTVTAQDSPPYGIFGFADGSTQLVSRFRLMTDTGVGYENRWVSRFTVQVSVTDTDPSSFVTVLNQASKNGGDWQEYTIDPAQAKYIKLILDQPGWGWRQLGEFEVYAAK